MEWLIIAAVAFFAWRWKLSAGQPRGPLGQGVGWRMANPPEGKPSEYDFLNPPTYQPGDPSTTAGASPVPKPIASTVIKWGITALQKLDDIVTNPGGAGIGKAFPRQPATRYEYNYLIADGRGRASEGSGLVPYGTLAGSVIQGAGPEPITFWYEMPPDDGMGEFRSGQGQNIIRPDGLSVTVRSQ